MKQNCQLHFHSDVMMLTPKLTLDIWETYQKLVCATHIGFLRHNFLHKLTLSNIFNRIKLGT